MKRVDREYFAVVVVMLVTYFGVWRLARPYFPTVYKMRQRLPDGALWGPWYTVPAEVGKAKLKGQESPDNFWVDEFYHGQSGVRRDVWQGR